MNKQSNQGNKKWYSKIQPCYRFEFLTILNIAALQNQMTQQRSCSDFNARPSMRTSTGALHKHALFTNNIVFNYAVLLPTFLIKSQDNENPTVRLRFFLTQWCTSCTMETSELAPLVDNHPSPILPNKPTDYL